MLADCLCVVAGDSLEISPYLPPLHLFGSYHKAEHRVFMSATVTDDAFLIKGLGLSPEVITNPIVDPDEKWAGEKMVLLPSLIDSRLDDALIVETFAKPVKNRKGGVVVLCPSFDVGKRWKSAGAMLATTEDLDQRVALLKTGARDDVLVVANRYDGIDLPDDVCRVLIVDGKPFAEGLQARYVEGCREGSEVVATRTARAIEQGLGRSVRGEKDYCAVLLIGKSLLKAIRSRDSLRFLSAQTRTQVEIGFDIAKLAQEEIADGVHPLKALLGLVQQCLKRDPEWKEFYVEQMNQLTTEPTPHEALHLFTAELEAEIHFAAGEYGDAVKRVQRLIDESKPGPSDKGWYLQEMARYTYPLSKDGANKLQVGAHQANRYLLKPQTGMVFTKVVGSQERAERIIEWAQSFASPSELIVASDEILSNLKFGVRADDFERAINDLGNALGFQCQRPDKEWKEGPDNLWALRAGEFLLAECKSEVLLTRKYVNKDETGQMNNANAWFEKNYAGAKVTRVMIIPTRELGKGAGFNHDVAIVTDKRLAKLVARARSFFMEFAALDLRDISDKKVQAFVEAHELGVDDIVKKYSESAKVSR